MTHVSLTKPHQVFGVITSPFLCSVVRTHLVQDKGWRESELSDLDDPLVMKESTSAANMVCVTCPAE